MYLIGDSGKQEVNRRMLNGQLKTNSYYAQQDVAAHLDPPPDNFPTMHSRMLLMILALFAKTKYQNLLVSVDRF